MKLKYKFLREGLKSNSGNLTWVINEWQHENGKLDICNNGLHCSLYPDQAFSYVAGEILALVETKGESIIQSDKECWSDMRIVKAYKWTRNDSVELAIYTAELVIDIFEKQYPNDDRPRKAIEAARAYTKNPNDKNAAYAASYAANAASYAASYAANAASYAAYAASYAANAASYAASYAAYAASYAANAASYAASYAANAASYAAYAASYAAYAASYAANAANAAYAASYAANAASYAADAAIVKKIRSWMTKRIKKLEKIK